MRDSRAIGRSSKHRTKLLGLVCFARSVVELDQAGESVLRQAITELGLSARAHDKILRMARTIADLADCDNIAADHLLEAVHYRRLDRQL